MKKTIFALILTMIILSGIALASTDYIIDEVKLNNNKIDNNPVKVELGSTIDLSVRLKSLKYIEEDIKVEAWIPGYDYGEIRVVSEKIRIKNNVFYNIPLELTIPEDLELKNNYYKLYIRVSGKNGYSEEVYNLFIEEKRHDIRFNDIIIWPENQIKDGELLYVKTRLENMGYKTEDNIRLQVSINELGVSNALWVNQLNPNQAVTTNNLPLRIPKGTTTGNYKVTLKLFYNRDHLIIEDSFNIYIEGADKTETVSEILFDKGKTEIERDKEETYKILIANMDNSKKIYTINVLNAESWSNIEISQNIISLNLKNVAEVRIKLTPKETGYKNFSIVVEEDGNKVKEQHYQVNVNENKSLNNSTISPILTTLGLGIVILIAIGLFIKKQRDLEEDTEEIQELQQKPLY